MINRILEVLFENSRIAPVENPSIYGIPYREVEFVSMGRKLRGWEIEGTGPAVILTHGWGANAEVFLPIIQRLATHGFHILAYDASNHGRSDKYSPTTIKTFVEDILSALDYLGTKASLIGHSMGAASSIIAGHSDERVNGVVAIAPFCSTEEIIKRMMGSIVPEKLKNKIVEKIEETVGFDLEEFSPCNYICRRKIPTLIIHGDTDATVPLEDSEQLKKNCPEAKLIVFQGDDHRSILVNEEVIRRIIKFLEKITG